MTAPLYMGMRLSGDTSHLSDNDLAAMVGRPATTTWGRAMRVVSVRRYSDPLLGPGVWIEAQSWDPPAFEVRAARITPLDAAGNPSGPSITLPRSITLDTKEE